MGRKTEITCDGCGTDLTYTGNCEDYYLIVTHGSKSPWYVKEGLRGGVLTSMAKWPPVDRDYYFCDLKCLDHWRDRRHYVERATRDWYEQWKAEHGAPDRDGKIRSYPSPSREIYEARDANFEAAALAAFPMSRINLDGSVESQSPPVVVARTFGGCGADAKLFAVCRDDALAEVEGDMTADTVYPVPENVATLAGLNEWLASLRVPQRDWKVGDPILTGKEVHDFFVFRAGDEADRARARSALLRKVAWSLHTKISRANAGIIWRIRPEIEEREHHPALAVGQPHAAVSPEYPDKDYVTDCPIVADKRWCGVAFYCRLWFDRSEG